jgi:hypothetical protein
MPLWNGRYVQQLPTTSAPKEEASEAPVEPEDLDLAEITQTISAIKAWLKTTPSQEEAMEVFQYELDHLNRSGAVGPSGCLTTYLEK